jgi:hypothetical protein
MQQKSEKTPQNMRQYGDITKMADKNQDEYTFLALYPALQSLIGSALGGG